MIEREETNSINKASKRITNYPPWRPYIGNFKFSLLIASSKMSWVVKPRVFQDFFPLS
jgi:hypothetical protein